MTIRKINNLTPQELSDKNLQSVTGGLTYEEIFEPYKQKDGTYKTVCDKCNAILIANDADKFAEVLNSHLGTHMNIDINPVVPNYYKGG